MKYIHINGSTVAKRRNIIKPTKSRQPCIRRCWDLITQNTDISEEVGARG